MLQKHSNSHKAFDTWSPESLAQNETLLTQSLSNLTMKQASKKICCENQPTTATVIQAEAEVGEKLPGRTRTWELQLQQQQLPKQFSQQLYNSDRINQQPVVPRPSVLPSPHSQLSSPPQQLSPKNQQTTNYSVPSDGIFPGGRLKQFVQQWKSITNHPWPISRNAKKTTTAEEQMHINSAVKKFLDGGMIEISPTQNRNFLSKFFTLQEKTRRRPILDCQKLNSFIQVEHFKIEGVPALRELIERDDFICKIDLKDAYVVVPIHPESQDFLSFENEGVVYRYKSLAFGLSIAPRIFSKAMRYAIEPLRKAGIRIIYYLDDLCLLAKTKHEMHSLTQKVRSHLEDLRLRIQQQDDGHLRTTTENSELIETGPSIAKTPQEIMPMDSGITGENNFNDTSYWGSSTPHSLPTTGSGEIPPSITSELGKNLQLILYQPRRTSLYLLHKQ
ncbi:hypothetical protein G6F37_010754 [Rhizopus arrhizus]|nr:hypothetical protein G6F38_010664 [Rhizopus arrhizus]KAG1152756.1 hypothetical protein G6F37_010754 [Rhizopus arrhizus]